MYRQPEPFGLDVQRTEGCHQAGIFMVLLQKLSVEFLGLLELILKMQRASLLPQALPLRLGTLRGNRLDLDCRLVQNVVCLHVLFSIVDKTKAMLLTWPPSLLRYFYLRKRPHPSRR